MIKGFLRRYSCKQLVLIYQFGKVGSTALASSIEGAVNVHDLYGMVPCPCGLRYRFSLAYRFLGLPMDRFVRRLLLRRREKIDIIVPVREPWSRNLSMFFEDLAFWYVDYFSTRRASKKVEGLALLKQVFLQSFEHESADSWFQKEFCRFVGVRLDEIAFDKSQGFAVFEKGRYRCLLLTVDHLRSEGGGRTIEGFLGRSVRIIDENRGEKKWYGGVYAELLSDSEFVDAYKKQMQGSVVQKTFFNTG
ncbi:putative capsular polysaccharide synthesis family protein [Rhodopirellula sallentina]|nr:putative capsular polysaccharide synthesis family protein [Rhodopirellula sallentina]